MTIKEQVAADWIRCKSLRYPPSWGETRHTDLHLLLADSFAAGCLSTYVQLPVGERLDDERIQSLVGCREEFLDAVPHMTDDEGKKYLELHLRMSTMLLVDCGVLDGGELANLQPTP